MKHFFRKKRAFTLIELLTVIAIIGVLIALLFPAIKSALGKAEASKAQTAIMGLTTAYKAYYTEYGKWPATINSASGIMTTTNWMVALLRGEDKSGTEGIITYYGNPRKIRFLEMKNADLVIDPVNNLTNFVDSWKNPYEVIFDISYSDLATNPFSPSPATFVHEGVLVWSKSTMGRTAVTRTRVIPRGTASASIRTI